MGWLLLVLIIGAAVFLVVKSRSKASDAPGQKSHGKWEGMAFQADAHCCNAAEGLNGKRFLIAEAPKVPLADCSDPALCKCKLRPIKDRRSGDDRRELVGALSREMPIGDERANKRSGRERRKEEISYD